MADLSHLSNDQLLALAQNKAPDLSHLSDADLLKIAQSTPMSSGKAALIKGEEGATLGLRPVVAGLGAAAGALADSPLSILTKQGFDNAKNAFLDARGEANQEQSKAQKDHPYISTASNLGGSLLTLPLLPAKGVAGAVGLGAGLGAAQAAGSANSLGEAATDIAGGAASGGLAYGAGKLLTGGIKNGATKLASAMTGIPDKEIETYAGQYDKVKNLIDKSGGSIPIAAEIQKENLQAAVKATKDHLNDQISQALNEIPQDKSINIAPIIKKMTEYTERLNPHLDTEAINQVKQITDRLSNVAGTAGAERISGKVSVQELQQIKQFLQTTATSTFEGSPFGFQVGEQAANAANQGFYEAKFLMDKFGPPEIKNANRQLFQLHKIEDRINKNLLIPGKSDAALMAVGSGAQNRDALALQRLGDITGKDVIGDAGALAAMNRFNSPAWSPAYGTGKSLYPVMIGSALGAVAGGSHGAAIGGLTGGAISSPAALKLAIDTGRISGQALAALGEKFGVKPGNLTAMTELLQDPRAQEFLIKAYPAENQAAASEKPNFSTTIRPRNK